MGINLDLKDKRILYELDLNSRTPASKIAKRVGLSTDAVNYRIKRLEKNKIISNYQIIVNLSRLKILQFKICLTFHHLTSKELERKLEILKKRKEIKWLASCKGKWDLMISLEGNSIQEIDSMKDSILSLFENKISQKGTSLMIESRVYNREYLIKNKQKKDSRISMNLDEKVKLDNVDIKILKELSQNARKPIVEIASSLGTTARVINYRIKQLIKKRVIEGFKISIDYEKIGIKFFKVFFYLDNQKKERLNSLIGHLQGDKNVIHYVKVLGSWDLEPEFEVFSEEEFDKKISEIKDKYSDIIKEVEVTTISKEHKFVYF